MIYSGSYILLRQFRTTAVALATALALIPADCGGGIGAPLSRIAWTSCGERLACATVPVPLDWNYPNGAQIKLSVIRHRASKPELRIGTIFTNPGGPGDTGVGFVRGSGGDLDSFGAGRFDWIGWDPRGTYDSTPVHCFHSEALEAEFWKGVAIPSTPTESDSYVKLTRDLARKCGEVMGPVLSHISTTDTVRDLDRLRELVGEERITYVGLSYGTVIGQVYANMFPSRVRAMLLDGIVDPVQYMANAEARAANSSESTDEVFAKFLELCDLAGPDRCALSGHGESATRRVHRLFDQAKRAPIAAPQADPPGVLLYSDLLISSFAPLRSPSTWPAYARQLNAAVEGNASELANAAYLMRTPKAWNEVTKSSVISCLDSPATQAASAWPKVITELKKISTLAGPVQGWWLWAPCASNWPARSDQRFTGPWKARTAVPILLIGTRYDPNTAYRNAVRSEKLLGNAVLLTHEGFGHISVQDPSRCIEDARVSYLVDLKTPPPGTVCHADQKPFMSPPELPKVEPEPAVP